MAGTGRSWTEREFETFIRDRGGIVSRAELLSAGWTADDLRIAHGWYGRPQRLRRGWYCSRDLPAPIKRAWAHGGPLACVSALRWYGEMPADDPNSSERSVTEEALHVCVPRHTRRRAIEAPYPVPVVLHWNDAARDPTARWAVPVEVARHQARHCTRLSRARS